MTNPNLESLRRAETDLLFAHLRPGMRVLELGGGNGLQARLLQERGCAVTSLDIPGREQPAVQHFPVQDYDGIHIPAANESFDANEVSNPHEFIIVINFLSIAKHF